MVLSTFVSQAYLSGIEIENMTRMVILQAFLEEREMETKENPNRIKQKRKKAIIDTSMHCKATKTHIV